MQLYELRVNLGCNSVCHIQFKNVTISHEFGCLINGLGTNSLSLFKIFLSNKGVGSFTAMTFNSIAKGNLEAVLDCDVPLDLKPEAMNKLMSVYAIVLLRAPSLTKFHP